MKKIYISANDLLLDSFKLAARIFDDGFRPDFIMGVWRGGAPTGIAVQEFFEYKGIQTDHIAIRTSSYTGINQQEEEVKVHGLSYAASTLKATQTLLIVDDVFDSGRSVDAIIKQLSLRCGDAMPKNLRVACPWYKPAHNKTERQPDYFIHQSSEWLVFPHELVGLSKAEIREGKPPNIAKLILEEY